MADCNNRRFLEVIIQ